MSKSPPAGSEPDEDGPVQRPVDVDGITIVEQIGPWLVEYRWPAHIDQGGPWAVTLRAAPGASDDELAGGISSTVLRQLDFREAAKKWRRHRQHADASPGPSTGKRAQRLQELVADGITDQYLATLAQTYVELVAGGESSVTTRLAELVGKKPETIKIHLKQARKRTLLTTVKGRAGGNLTDEARRVLGS